MVTLRRVTASADRGTADGLGALLVLLHGADAPFDTVQAVYRQWRHRQRTQAALTAAAEQQNRRVSPDETFRFEPPAGEEIEPLHGMHRLRYVTLPEAQQQAPFTVLMPDTVPHTWQVQCRFITASQRPPSPTEIGLSYDSVDGHESISLTQTAAGPSNPHTQFVDEENWENVTRDGIAMRTRPAHWGQAQVELELEGTWVHLMSDNLTRDQVLRIAAGLRPAPSTSSI
jgi:hypothetical protein